MPNTLVCAYLKGHLRGRALDWFEIFGYSLVQGTVADFAQLKEALTENFPVVRNKKLGTIRRIKIETKCEFTIRKKSDEGVVDVDSSVSSGSEYQSNSLEESRPRLDRSQGFRSSESGERQLKIQGQVQKKGRFSQAGSSKEVQAHITSEAEETSPGKPVSDLQEDQYKPRRDQSDSEENI
ncbi:hypothetical protein TNCV_180241 [Trichonephila clavipes]|nr:hypothetical protein TNCV_180241 [Trichonephila clavipes]